MLNTHHRSVEENRSPPFQKITSLVVLKRYLYSHAWTL